MLSFILLAADGDSIVTAMGGVIVLLITALTAALIKIRKSKTEDDIAKAKAASENKQAEVKVGDVSRATTFEQMQTIVRQLTQRIEQQDAKLDAKDSRIDALAEEIAGCHAERAELIERVKWLEHAAGKDTPGSKEHPALGADI